MTRTTERLALMSNSPGTARSLLVHRYGRPGARPKAYLQASLHADEIPAMLALHHLARLLDEADAAGDILGEILLVPYANPIGLAQGVGGEHLGRYHLDSAGNFNRNWPDLGAGLAERLEGRLTGDPAANVALVREALGAAVAGLEANSEMASLRAALIRLAYDADLLLDVHCDDAALLYLYLSPAHWPAAADLAAELGCRAVMLAEDSGGRSFDESFSLPWLKLAAAFPDHPIPPACLSGTVELRGRPDVCDALAAADAGALFRTLQRRGLVAGDPGPLPEPLCEATRLDACEPGPLPAPQCEATLLVAAESIKAPAAGILSYTVALGDRVRKGERIAWLIDPAAESPAGGRREILAGTDGLVLSARVHKYVLPGMNVMKIVGSEPLPGREGGYLLDD